jgi:RNA polymerase sigma-54 factor
MVKQSIQSKQVYRITQRTVEQASVMQMSRDELGAFLQQKSESNPFLEYHEPMPSGQVSTSTLEGGFDLDDAEPSGQLDSGNASEKGEFTFQISSKPSFYDKIGEQVAIEFAENRQKMIAFSLLDSCDERGYLTKSVADIADSLKTKEKDIRDVQAKMAFFEPVGCFADDFATSIKWQLQYNGIWDIKHQKALEQLANGQVITDKDLHSGVWNDIRKCNPAPASEYDIDQSMHLAPDLVAALEGGEYRVNLNEAALPKILVNKEFQNQLANSRKSSDRRFYIDNLREAGEISRMLEIRALNLLNIANYIVQKQKGFLQKGIYYLMPLGFAEVAEKLEISTSTVSRLVNQKYIQTPSGTFELRFFFNGDVGDNTSSRTIKQMIADLVEAENKLYPLSDQDISDDMTSLGVSINRRLVAKYRKELRLPIAGKRSLIGKRKYSLREEVEKSRK